MLRLLIVAGWTILLAAQQPRTFDVAVIKPSDPGNNRFGMGFGPSGRTLSVDGMTTRGIIREAYGLFPEQLVVGPSVPNAGWIDSLRFDITAKSEGTTPLSKEQLNQMFQSLVTMRFGLKTHSENRKITVYSLVVAKTGSKLGEGDTAGPYLNRPSPGKLVGTKVSMASLVRALSGQLDRPAFDDTGLQGAYDFTLTWSPDDADPTKPSLFTALQDQLGLRLESKKRAIDMLVVDSIEKPTEN